MLADLQVVVLQVAKLHFGHGRQAGIDPPVCKDFLRSSEDLPSLPQRVGSWWNHDASEEVDAVALGEAEILVAECKLGRLDMRHLETLRRRATRGRRVRLRADRPPRAHLGRRRE
jgi:hypothetical protein